MLPYAIVNVSSPELNKDQRPQPGQGFFSWLGSLSFWQPIKKEPQPIPSILHTPAVMDSLSELSTKVSHPFTAGVVVRTMFDLAERLNPGMANYDLVVGDDTSGRLPAILYWRLINKRRNESGLPPAACRFMSGRYLGDSAPPLPIESTPGSRALIITEWIQTSSSVKTIYDAVKKIRDGSRIDIGSLGRANDKALDLGHGSAVFAADNSPNDQIDHHLYGPAIRQHIGVHKSWGDLHSKRLGPIAFSAMLSNKARADIQTIADTIYPLLPTT
jgi:hypothetical protein